jgi:outer membrane lipoprotein-sorting protein
MLLKKSTYLGLLLCLSYAGSGMAADSKPSAVPKLTAEQIIERNLAARGGLKAWHDVRTMSWSGKMEAGTGDTTARSWRYTEAALMPKPRQAGHGKDGAFVMAANPDKPLTDKQVQLPFVLDMERPHKSRLEIEFAGKTAVQVYDGSHGWKLRPFLNRNDVDPFTADEAKAEARKAGIDGPLVDYAAKGTKVAFDGVEAVEGKDAYRLALTLKNGDVQHVWIDAKSFLDVKVEGTPRWMDGKMRTVWVYQRDFRPVDGLMMPFVLETAVDGFPNTHKVMIEKVALNPKLDEALFSKPKS